MAANAVNLDALIPRRDFEAAEETSKQGDFEKIQIFSLVRNQHLYVALRKPDFQRETAVWSPQKIFDLVQAFVQEDLVPGVILWRSPANFIFVIDGAHRLSSLIAWANDDYGTGAISHDFFDGELGQLWEIRKKNADKTKQLIEDKFGKFRDIQDAYSNPNATEAQKKLGLQLVNCGLRVQWLVNADAKKAENSFFKINEQGEPLDKAEVALLYSRECPNAVAARAINQYGAGHAHWKKFDEEKREQIKALSKEIHKELFSPVVTGNTIKSPSLPPAGRSSAAGSLALLMDSVNITNEIVIASPLKSREDAEKSVPPDKDGTRTIEFLKTTEKTMSRIKSDKQRSLGLYPLVYFYSENGRHLPTSFLAVVQLVSELEKNDQFKVFTRVRARFEDFLLSHKDFVQQISRQSRGQLKAVQSIRGFLFFIYEALKKDLTDDAIVKLLRSSKEFSFLKAQDSVISEQPKDFSSDTKSRAFIIHALSASAKCSICGARIADDSISNDHITDQKNNGGADLANLQFTHRYCNSAKDQLRSYIASEAARTE
jgi:hypothetical protein